MNTPKDIHEHERCTLHGQHCCRVCCRHDGDCDYGSCVEPAVTLVDCCGYGRVVERRPACAKHACNLPNGVGYVLERV
jgi:hypothetical protein